MQWKRSYSTVTQFLHLAMIHCLACFSMLYARLYNAIVYIYL